MSNGLGDWLSGAEMQQLLNLLIQLIKYLIMANVGWRALPLLGLLFQAMKLLASEAWTWDGRAEAGLRRRMQTLSRDFGNLIRDLLAAEAEKIAFLANQVVKPFQAMHAAMQAVRA